MHAHHSNEPINTLIVVKYVKQAWLFAQTAAYQQTGAKKKELVASCNVPR